MNINELNEAEIKLLLSWFGLVKKFKFKSFTEITSLLAYVLQIQSSTHITQVQYKIKHNRFGTPLYHNHQS